MKTILKFSCLMTILTLFAGCNTTADKKRPVPEDTIIQQNRAPVEVIDIEYYSPNLYTAAYMNNKGVNYALEGEYGKALVYVNGAIIKNQSEQIKAQLNGSGEPIVTELEPVYWDNMNTLLSPPRRLID